MANPGLIKGYEAEADIQPHRIVAHGSALGKVVTAAAADDPLCGVTLANGAVAGTMVDVCKSGLADIQFGGTVAAGDPLTSDASGKAIKATVANSKVIGFAEQAAVDGDIMPFHVSFSLLPAQS